MGGMVQVATFHLSTLLKSISVALRWLPRKPLSKGIGPGLVLFHSDCQRCQRFGVVDLSYDFMCVCVCVCQIKSNDPPFTLYSVNFKKKAYHIQQYSHQKITRTAKEKGLALNMLVILHLASGGTLPAVCLSMV